MTKQQIVQAITAKFGEQYKVPVSNLMDEKLITPYTFRDWAIREDYLRLRKEGKLKVCEIHDYLEENYFLSRSRIIQICRVR